MHRPFADWDKIARRNEPGTVEAQVYGGLQRLIAVRKDTPAFAGADMAIVDTGNAHVFGYVRQHAGTRIVILANFSEHEQRVDANTVRNHGLSYSFRDLVTGDTMALGEDLRLEPYRFFWMAAI